MAKRDYYDVLGVSRNATADDIKKAHRKLVRQYHPDVNKNNKSAEEKFKEAQEAYDVLSDTSKRQNYDQFGHAGVGAGSAAGGANVDPFEAFRRAQQGRGRGGAQAPYGGGNADEFDFGGGGSGGGYGDIFEQLFGGGAPGARARGNPGRGGRGAPSADRGSDIEYPISITFEEAARGTTRTLQMSRGAKAESLEIKVPGGVKDKLRLKGKGEEGPGGRGDLVLIISVHPHPYFRKDGLDVLMDAPISLYEALLGTKLTVPTIDGELTLTVPPGTSSGAKLRIKERGVFRGSEKGDQFVVIKIIVPKELDADDKAAIEALAKKHPINARLDTKWNG